MKKLLGLFITLTLVFLVSCDMTNVTTNTTTNTETSTTSEAVTTLANTYESVITEAVDFEKAEYEEYELLEYTVLDGTSESYMITESGTYVLTGTITETVIIDVGDEDVRLILDNVTIQTETDSAILVLSGDDVTISAPEGTENYLTDSAVYSEVNQEYNGVIYSECDLVINGSGSITVNALFNNGIITKDDLVIMDVTLNITSVDDGIIGRDSLEMKNVTITIDSLGDGIKSTYEYDEGTAEELIEKGYIYIDSGNFVITSGDDAIDATSEVVIIDGSYILVSSSQGISSNLNLYIMDGYFEITSTDDCINADVYVEINGGEFILNTSDDGIKGNDLVVINDGYITIETCFEGIEGTLIEINGGVIDIVAEDDGVNATGTVGNNVGETNQVVPDEDVDQVILYINGGDITIVSVGDGIDANGSILMTGGSIVSSGTTAPDSAIDFDIFNFTLTGGEIFGIGSSMMAMGPTDTSEQGSFMVILSSYLSAGSDVVLYDGDGLIVCEYETAISSENIVIASDELVVGNEYVLSIDGLDDIEFELELVTFLDEDGVREPLEIVEPGGGAGGPRPPR